MTTLEQNFTPGNEINRVISPVLAVQISNNKDIPEAHAIYVTATANNLPIGYNKKI